MLDLSRPWHELPVVVLDTETTGVGEDDRIVELAACRFEGGMPVAKWSAIVDPGREIPADVTAVHGISNDDVRGMPRLGAVLHGFAEVCKGAVPCAFNSEFDRKMLHRELAGSNWLALNVTCLAFDTEQTWIDPLVIVRDADKYEKGKKLQDACGRRGIVMEGAHRALADVLACGALLWALKPRIGDISAEQLIRKCDKRRSAQEADFQAWLARQPKKESAA